ncbi:pyridoxal 4-dehydrogenase [Pseudohyphozyma bogoriensis]|nr:pyridoxal 4-dehydrogenase [Pseudohyphozyma bogoriensis]
MAAASKVFKMGSMQLPRPAYGAMGLSVFYTPDPADIETYKNTLRRAIDIGCTVWNTADMYGFGANEELLGSVLREGDNRSKVFLITKFGGVPGPGGVGVGIDGSPEHAAEAIEASIKRLGSAPDAWALHRIDKKTPIEETMKAMEAIRQAGKTKFLGISECSAETLRRASKVAKIDFIEVEYSPWTTTFEENGVLALAKELGCIVLAYSPLGRGRYKSREDFKAGDFRANLPRLQADVWEQNYKIVQEFERLAAKKGCTAGQLSLAWLMAQGPHIVPIPGTKSEKYLIENFASRDIQLSEEEVKEIRDVVEANKAIGHRYPEATRGTLDE